MALLNFTKRVLSKSTKNHRLLSPLFVEKFKPKFAGLFCSPLVYNDSKEAPKKRKDYRHNYDEEVEGAVNNQILAELNASMVYLSISCYYGRTDIALPGCQGFFKKLYLEEQTHAMEFIDYQLERGGQVKLYPITVPEDPNWTDITIAFGISLEMEKRVKEKLECLHETAESHGDMQLMDMISSKFIKEQNSSIWELGRLLTRAKRLVDTGGIGRHLFDMQIHQYVAEKYPDAPKAFYI